MKIFVAFLILMILVIVPIVIMPFAPYYIYKKAINEGLESRFLTIKVENKMILKGKKLNFTKEERHFLSMNKNRWRKFHLKNFLVPFPVYHPIYNLIPVVHKNISGKNPGAKFLNNKGDFFGDFIPGKSFSLTRPYKNQQLYGLPLFKKYLLKIPNKKIWRDIFEKDLNLPKGDLFSFNNIKNFFKVDYFELVYRLFLLEMREIILGENVDDFYFIPEKKIGVVIPAVKGNRQGLKSLKLFILNKGKYHTVYLRYLKGVKEGRNLKIRIINSLEYRPSNEKIAKRIYLKFKDLSYKDQISSKGTVYLFSAWSHFLKNKEFVREMIQFLERGTRNDLVLQELYQYSFKNFGTTFSRKEEFLKETQMLKLKRKIEKEEQDFINKVRKEEIVPPEENLESKEEQVKIFLQEAKTEGSDLDDEEDALIVE